MKQETVEPSAQRGYYGAETMYQWKAPSGVMVVSSQPPVENKWWDHPLLHPIWSYASWGTMILVAFDRPGLRKFLARRGWWK